MIFEEIKNETKGKVMEAVSRVECKGFHGFFFIVSFTNEQ